MKSMLTAKKQKHCLVQIWTSCLSGTQQANNKNFVLRSKILSSALRNYVFPLYHCVNCCELSFFVLFFSILRKLFIYIKVFCDFVWFQKVSLRSPGWPQTLIFLLSLLHAGIVGMYYQAWLLLLCFLVCLLADKAKLVTLYYQHW